jgi:membrane-associated phospholipid phosphatase
MISRDTVANVTSPRADSHEGVANVTGDSNDETTRLRGARSIAVCIVCAYLAASALVLVGGGRAGFAAAHALGVCVLVWSLISKHRAARVVGDLAPLFLMPVLYAELPQLIAALGTRYHDATVQGWEVFVFGGQPSRQLATALPNVRLSELLHAGYLAYYPAVFAPALLLYATHERRAFARTVLALTTTYAVCWAIFACFPVEGPRYAWGAPLGVPDGFFRRTAVTLLAKGSSRGAAFPSSHMAISTVQAVIAWRWNRSAAVVLTVIAVLVGCGAVYGGFHYGVDVVGGALLGGGIGLVLIALERRLT